MLIFDAAAIDHALDVGSLIDAMQDAFAGDIVAPKRHHHEMERPGETGTLLLMPAWTGPSTEPAFLATKIVTVYPDNALRSLPSVIGTTMLMDGASGQPLAAMDGTRLTLHRTAAASGLAARYLAREGASRLVMVGAGALAPFMIRAHAAVRPIEQVTIWNHNAARAEALAESLSGEAFKVDVVRDLETAVRQADIVSCATLTTEPIVRGAWLREGAHLDMVGAFNLRMREADDEALLRASVFIDTQAAKSEGGDVALALKSGAIAEAHVRGDLFDLARGKMPGRTDARGITVFKSVGTAIEDLAAAMLVWRRARAKA